MQLVDIIILAVILLAIGGAVAYIIREKKKGRACIGCPYSASCQKSHCTCNKEKNTKS